MKKNNQKPNGEIIETEDGYLLYCQDGVPTHAGVVCVDGKIYYAGVDGELVCGHHKDVHREMANGLLKRGIYKFGEDGVLEEGSYRKPERKKRTGTRQQLTKKQKQMAFAGTMIVVLIALALLLSLHSRDASQESVGAPTIVSQNAAADAAIVLPPENELVYLCSPSMQEVYAGTMTLEEAVQKGETPYQPYVFRYTLKDGASAVLTLDGTDYNLDPAGSALEIQNLETGRAYRYTVTVTADGAARTLEGSFRTADTNRFIALSGVSNTRDIGGYRTRDGRRVAEGKIIRGSELDGKVVPDFTLKNPLEATPLAFRYDFDLRSEDTADEGDPSPLGTAVGHRFYSAPMYGEIFQYWSPDRLREIFADLAKAENYPMYLHCSYGADRTGTIVFLLQGLLGVSEADMRFEYELTGFSVPGMEKGKMLDQILTGLAVYPGDSLQEKIEQFLTETVGVPKANLASIRSILLES